MGEKLNEGTLGDNRNSFDRESPFVGWVVKGENHCLAECCRCIRHTTAFDYRNNSLVVHAEVNYRLGREERKDPLENEDDPVATLLAASWSVKTVVVYPWFHGIADRVKWTSTMIRHRPSLESYMATLVRLLQLLPERPAQYSVETEIW